MPYFNYIIGNINYLLNMMNADVFYPFFGTTFLYVVITGFFIWVSTNIFVIRPLVGGALLDGTITAANIHSNRAELRRELSRKRNESRIARLEKSKIQRSTRVVYGKPDKNGNRPVVSARTTSYNPVSRHKEEYIDI